MILQKRGAIRIRFCDKYFMFRFILLLVAQSAIVIYVFPLIHPNFQVKPGIEHAVITVLLFMVLNWLLRRLLVIFTLGLGWIAYYLTFGLLGIVINAVVLIMIDEYFRELLTVPDYVSAGFGGLALAIANYVLGRK